MAPWRAVWIRSARNVPGRPGRGRRLERRAHARLEATRPGRSLPGHRVRLPAGGPLPEIQRRIGRVFPRAKGIRRAGTAALDLAHIACGIFEGISRWGSSSGTSPPASCWCKKLGASSLTGKAGRGGLRAETWWWVLRGRRGTCWPAWGMPRLEGARAFWAPGLPICANPRGWRRPRPRSPRMQTRRSAARTPPLPPRRSGRKSQSGHDRGRGGGRGGR